MSNPALLLENSLFRASPWRQAPVSRDGKQLGDLERVGRRGRGLVPFTLSVHNAADERADRRIHRQAQQLEQAATAPPQANAALPRPSSSPSSAESVPTSSRTLSYHCLLLSRSTVQLTPPALLRLSPHTPSDENAMRRAAETSVRATASPRHHPRISAGPIQPQPR